MRNLNSTSLTRKDLRVSRTGTLLQDTHEVYLRRDIPCGYSNCVLCTEKSEFFQFEEEDLEPNSLILIPDIVGLAQSLDCILNSDIFENMVVPHSDLDLLALASKSAFKKLKIFLELDNHGQMLVFPNRFSADVHSISFNFTSAQRSAFDSKSFESLVSLLKLARFYCSHLRFVKGLRVIILSDGSRLQFLQSLASSVLGGARVSGIRNSSWKTKGNLPRKQKSFSTLSNPLSKEWFVSSRTIHGFFPILKSFPKILAG